MIVREIWEDETLIAQFDYFNDFRDTDNWLRAMAKSDDQSSGKAIRLREALQAGYEKWLVKRLEQLR